MRTLSCFSVCSSVCSLLALKTSLTDLFLRSSMNSKMGMKCYSYGDDLIPIGVLLEVLLLWG